MYRGEREALANHTTCKKYLLIAIRAGSKECKLRVMSVVEKVKVGEMFLLKSESFTIISLRIAIPEWAVHGKRTFLLSPNF